VSFSYAPADSGWQEITGRDYQLEKDVWHWVRVIVQGDEITAYIDDVLVIYTDDHRIKSGSAQIQVGEYSHAQFDDLQVVLID
jgi:hypothetical protein